MFLRSYWHATSLLLATLFVCLTIAEEASPVLAPASTVTITTAKGAESTKAVYENPNGVPRVTWNCAAMPAICMNMASAAKIDKRSWTINDKGRDYVELHWDADAKAKSQRRRSRCGSFRTGSCPGNLGNRFPIVGLGIDQNQPSKLAWTDLKGGLFDGAVFGATIDGTKVPRQVKPLSYIVDQTRAARFTGQIWTCEEYPPACTVEGSDYIISTAMCAPMNAACAAPGSDAQRYWGRNFVRTEQNFQGTSLSRLATVVREKRDRDPGKAWTWKLATDYHRLHITVSQWVAIVQFAGTKATAYPKNTKRAIEIFNTENVTDDSHSYQITEYHYENGSYSRTHDLFRKGASLDLEHIHSFNGSLGWFTDAELDLDLNDDSHREPRDEQEFWDGDAYWNELNDEDANFSPCLLEELKDPSDIHPGDPDIEDTEAELRCCD